jgi:dTDP-4-dehydrorhamnose reductase
MKIVLFGKNGQLGRELLRELAPFGELLAVGRQELDLLDAAALDAFIRLHKPQVIVNASAYTAVDRAEQEPELAFQVNSRAPGLMAELACELNAAFIHFSTDYVFDGTLGRPYVETDTPNPLNVYGKSKLAGEQAIQKAGGAYLILRTSWVYSMSADNFVTKVLRWARQNETLRIVDDQIGNPTWVRTLAKATSQILARGYDFITENKGVYHLAGDGFARRYEWAKEILKLDLQAQAQIAKELEPAATAEFPALAKRPLFSALNCAKFKTTFGLELPGWQQTLALAMQDHQE